MSFVYTPAKTALLNGNLDFAANDIRVILVMTNTTADTEQDNQFVSSLTTLDEMDGANYARATLTGEAVNEDAANDRAEFDANDAVFTNLGAGTRNVQGAIVYKHVTNDTDSPLIAFIDTGGFPYTANGATLTISWNAEGILQAT